MGHNALYSTTTGSGNLAIGFRALYSNTTGDANYAYGSDALYSNTTGIENQAIGNGALYSNTTGSRNVAVGKFGLWANTTGTNNTAIGYNASVLSDNLTNSTAIGSYATVSSSNTIQLGNTNITDVISAGAYSGTSFNSSSDLRLKRNITQLTGAVQTILQLKPVHYEKRNNLTTTEYATQENGFIAQEILKVLPYVVTESKDAQQLLSVNYTAIIPLLTKGMQEQQQQIQQQQQQIDELKALVQQLLKKNTP